MNDGDICLYVVDASCELSDDDRDYMSQLEGRKAIAILNKSDLVSVVRDEEIHGRKIHVSAKTHTGLDDLKTAVYELACDDGAISEGLNVSALQLEELRGSLQAVRDARDSLMEDVIAGLIGSARVSLLRVLGVDAGDEVIDAMFSRFCVGK